VKDKVSDPMSGDRTNVEHVVVGTSFDFLKGNGEEGSISCASLLLEIV